MSKSQDRLTALSEEISTRLIEQLEQGTAPWQKPWSGVISNPHNPLTNTQYSGANWLFLQLEAEVQGYSDPRWMTFKQISDAGGRIKKGEHGTPCLYWADKWLDKDGNPLSAQAARLLPAEEKQRIMIPCRFTVFNAEQTEGLNLPEWNAPEVTWDPNERAEKILTASKAVIHHKFGNQAFYSPSNDSITLPERGQFAKASDYYDTALHELGHWTGHETRLNRDLSGRFGTPDYAKEELRAEIASMMLAAEIGLPHNTQQHASYVASWIKVLKEDPTEIIRASADAQKITDFVKNLEKDRYFVVDYEKNAVLRLTHDELLSGIRKTFSNNPEALQKFDSLANRKHETLSPEYMESAAIRMFLDPPDTRAMIYAPLSKHRGVAFTKDPHLFFGYAKLQPDLEDKAFRFLQRLEGREIAEKARADWETEEKQHTTNSVSFSLNSANYWQALDKAQAKGKTVPERASEKFKTAPADEQSRITKEAAAAVKSEKRFYLIDYEANDVQTVTHGELMAKANAILNQNPAGRAEFDKALPGQTDADKLEYETDRPYRERKILRLVLDPTISRAHTERCPCHHAGLFVTDDPLTAVAAATFRSTELAEKAAEVVQRVDDVSINLLHKKLMDPSFADSLAAQRKNAQQYWKTLETERQQNASPQAPEEPKTVSARKFFVIDFENNTVEKVTHAQFTQKARDIVAKQPLAAAEFEKARNQAPSKITQRRERYLYGMVLDPSMPWSRLHGVLADHQGLFVTSNPTIAVGAARLKSPDLAQKALDEAIKDSRYSYKNFQKEILEPDTAEEMALIQHEMKIYWGVLAEKRLQHGIEHAGDPQLLENLQKLKTEDRQFVKEEAAQALANEKHAAYEAGSTYYVVDFKTQMVHRWSHEQVMRVGLSQIQKDPKALQQFEAEKAFGLKEQGMSSEKAEATALCNRLSPNSKDVLIGIERHHPGFYFSKDPAECLAAASLSSPKLTDRIALRVRLAEGKDAETLAKSRAERIVASPLFQANWALYRPNQDHAVRQASAPGKQAEKSAGNSPER